VARMRDTNVEHGDTRVVDGGFGAVPRTGSYSYGSMGSKANQMDKADFAGWFEAQSVSPGARQSLMNSIGRSGAYGVPGRAPRIPYAPGLARQTNQFARFRFDPFTYLWNIPGAEPIPGAGGWAKFATPEGFTFTPPGSWSLAGECSPVNSGTAISWRGTWAGCTVGQFNSQDTHLVTTSLSIAIERSTNPAFSPTYWAWRHYTRPSNDGTTFDLSYQPASSRALLLGLSTPPAPQTVEKTFPSRNPWPNRAPQQLVRTITVNNHGGHATPPAEPKPGDPIDRPRPPPKGTRERKWKLGKGGAVGDIFGAVTEIEDFMNCMAATTWAWKRYDAGGKKRHGVETKRIKPCAGIANPILKAACLAQYADYTDPQALVDLMKCVAMQNLTDMIVGKANSAAGKAFGQASGSPRGVGIKRGPGFGSPTPMTSF